MTTESRTIEFHRTFGHPVRDTPQTLSREESLLALKLIEEEFFELADALFPGCRDAYLFGGDPGATLTEELEDYPHAYAYEPNLVEVADALGDLDVVINGGGIRHGLDMQAISREVFRSNMSKMGADGKPIYREDGKLLKGPNFSEPNLAAVLGIEVAV